jgi:hypothetical protein
VLTTSRHNLYKPEITDDIIDSINKISQNFDYIDDKLEESADNLVLYLQSGEFYEKGRKIWNNSPSIGEPLGWVNIRDGVYAPTWQRLTTYSVGSVVQPDENNGHYYECVVSGTSCINEPPFPLSSGQTVSEAVFATTWTASTIYNVGDIVKPTNGDESYIYRCITSGMSDVIEPTWIKTDGTTIVDGSVVWYVHKTVVWQEKGESCLFVPFGEVKESSTYVFEQTTPSNKWNIVHNLNKFPYVTIFDEYNDLVYADVKYISPNEIEINFSQPIKGKCYLN